MSESAAVRLERHDDVLVMILDNPPVNAGSVAVRRGLLDGVASLSQDESLRGAVIIGDHGTFISGSDLREFGATVPPPRLVEVIRAIEHCSRPIVAAIDGHALGGGFELGLACDGRVATSRAIMGLPEVSLGMVPGGGGSQRLPRLVGRGEALELIVSSRRFDGTEALSSGIVDDLVEVDELLPRAIAVALAIGKRVLMDLQVRADSEILFDDVASRLRESGLRESGHRPNVGEAIRLVGLAGTLDSVTSLLQEREVFDRLRLGDEAAALRHLFFAERAASRSGAVRPVGDKIASAIRAEAARLEKEGVPVPQVIAALEAFGWSPLHLGIISTDGADGSSPIDADAIARRLVISMVLESAELVDGGEVRRAADVDVAAVRELGFPRHLGGPVWWSAHLDPDVLTAAVGAVVGSDRSAIDRVMRMLMEVRDG